jgi:hypothetical protein
LIRLREEQASDITTKARSLLGQRVDHGCYFWHPPLLRADDGHLLLCYATAPTLHSKQSKEVNPQRKMTFLAPATFRTHRSREHPRSVWSDGCKVK